MIKDFKPILLFICSVSLATFIWEFINFPFDEASLLKKYDNIENLHNPINDVIRFILYLAFPFIILIFYYQKKSKLFFKNLKIIFFFEKDLKKHNLNYAKDLNVFVFLVFTILIIEFLILDFTKFNFLADLFHEGMWLSASQNLKLSNQYWQSSFIVHGFFADFYPYYLWDLIGKESVGVTRFFQLFIILLNKILLLFIIRKISLFTNFPNVNLITFFLTFCAIILPLQAYAAPIFSERSFLLLLFVLFFLNFFQNYNNNIYRVYLLGIFSSLTSFWFIDIAIYINTILIILICFFCVKSEFRKLFSLLFSILFGWLIFFLIFPNDEFFEFLNNTYLILTTLSWHHGLNFPTPFISLDARSGKSIILFLITGYLIINLINFYKKDKSLFIIGSILLYITSLLYFNYGLNRSDSGHIRVASSFIFIPFISIFLFFLFEKLKVILQNNMKSLKYFNVLLILIIAINTLLIDKKYERKSLKNVLNSRESILKLVNYTDEEFINSNHKKFINYYKDLTKKDNCALILTNEVGLFYFLKKKSCSKHYFMWISSTKKIQEELIKDIRIKKPEFIIYNSEKDIFYNYDIMLKTLNKYILNNYIFYEKFDGWDIYKLK